MADDFKYDVFLSHSTDDKEVVQPLAERLQADGLRVWFEPWETKLWAWKALLAKKIEEGLEHSRVLVLCISANALGSAWAQLEAGTFRFRDPLNKERRFIPLRLADIPMQSSLAQFPFINWAAEDQEQEYKKLLKACCLPTTKASAEEYVVQGRISQKTILLHYGGSVSAYSFDSDGKRVLSSDSDRTVRLWDLETGRCLRTLNGHTGSVQGVVWSAKQHSALSCSQDNTLRLWDVETGGCLRILDGHTAPVESVAWSSDLNRALSCSSDKTVRLWDVKTGRCLRTFEGHTARVSDVAWSIDQQRVLSGSDDNTLRLWEIETSRCLRVIEGHTDFLNKVAWSPDGLLAVSSGNDSTARLWNVETGRCLRVLEGHKDAVLVAAWHADQRYIITGSRDTTLRLWDVETGQCLLVLRGHTSEVRAVVWSADQGRIFSGDQRGSIRIWDIPELIKDNWVPEPLKEGRGQSSFSSSLSGALEQVQYTNAKVLLVGESGTGKTGLSKRLALNEWQPSDSTVGAWATHWKLPIIFRNKGANKIEKEIWLWDFGGQADQRLIHQLYMDETALAVLVFDGQKEDLFETLGQWDRDITRASRNSFSKLLVAGRVDAGGLRISRAQIEAFRKERGYLQLLETSAKTNLGCEELKQAIVEGIRWENIPWRSSPLLFKQLKEEIVRLKDEGRVLMRFNELRETLQLRLLEEEGGKVARFTDEELRAVISLLAGPGVVWELKFGNWILLQPERINAYAQAVIQTMRMDEHERGCLAEERVLNGGLTYHSSMERLEGDEERFILLAMHQTLMECGLCLREQTDKGPLLVFPSYYRRERPELVGHPAVLVGYRFNGFLDEVYATLVVRLHHTQPFEQDELWRYAADFKTLTGRQLGVKMTRLSEGAGELEVYFEPEIPVEEKIIFSRYVHEHLLQSARDVVRLRYYVCPYCGTPVGNREVAMRKLEEGKRDIVCVDCERRIPLWDPMEELFASPEMKQQVHDLQKESDIVLDNESKERALVGEVISTVALAGQISREFNVSDHGIDMEIEFKSDDGKATGQKLYLQLKSGDSYLRARQGDDAEIFRIKDESHVRYWMKQKFPVLLVIRNSKGEVRWMEVRDHLKRESNDGRKLVRQIVFKGERFDVMSVRRWREHRLKKNH